MLCPIAALLVAVSAILTSRRARSEAQLFATKLEMEDGFRRFEKWIEAMEERNRQTTHEAIMSREALAKTVSKLSNDIHRVLGRFDGQSHEHPHPRHHEE